MEEVWVSVARYAATEQLTGILLGANVLRLQTGEIGDWIRRDPRVLEARVRVRVLGKRVEVEIKERRQAVEVRLAGGEAVWVDAEGVILEPAVAPKVVGVPQAGDRVAREAVAAARAVSQLSPALHQRLSTFDISDPTSVTAQGEGSMLLLLGEIGQLGERLAILEELWRRGVVTGYATVDLRGGDEVILKRKR